MADIANEDPLRVQLVSKFRSCGNCDSARKNDEYCGVEHHKYEVGAVKGLRVHRASGGRLGKGVNDDEIDADAARK